jgi:DNA-binding NtrC family response regulator
VPESRPTLQSPERPKRVLLVEDSIPVRDSIARRLRADGYDVVDAVTVSEVLAYVARGVDVMVTDIVLSDSVDGWTLATRARELNPMLPLVFMSGFMTSRQPELLSGNELASFVRKPVNGAELNTVIAGLLALRETRQLQSELPRK